MENYRGKAAELSYISKLVGQDELYVQAGGGNTSVKLDDKLMLVKASGFQLTEVTETSGYSVADYSIIAEHMASGTLDDSREQEILAASLADGLRPSIETFLHSITRTYTIHTHPLGVTIYASKKNGMEELKQMFPQSLTVGYATPGVRLARLCYDAVSSSPDAQVIFLANHGLIVSADTAEEALSLHREITKKIDSSLGLDTMAADTGEAVFRALQGLQRGCIAYRVETKAVCEILKKRSAAWRYAFSPDCVVYCGNGLAELETDYANELRIHREKYGEIKAVIANGYCFAVAENVKKARDIACMLDFTARLALSGAELTELTQQEKNFLLNWDSEKYRASMK